ncbi:hypothetical protein ACH5RR_023723 [Cinchona calisaya]|uniref:Uncharacterized protein n=1 Tax=Cinchona calisaya TaxID=153742 RepID=A0ABD2ZDC6_9GENT
MRLAHLVGEDEIGIWLTARKKSGVRDLSRGKEAKDKGGKWRRGLRSKRIGRGGRFGLDWDGGGKWRKLTKNSLLVEHGGTATNVTPEATTSGCCLIEKKAEISV